MARGGWCGWGRGGGFSGWLCRGAARREGSGKAAAAEMDFGGIGRRGNGGDVEWRRRRGEGDREPRGL